jgi:hypothetical protein
MIPLKCATPRRQSPIAAGRHTAAHFFRSARKRRPDFPNPTASPRTARLYFPVKSLFSVLSVLPFAFADTVAAMPFKAAVVIDEVTSPREWLVVEDLNGDARPDILCAAPGGGLRWWRNEGAGSFTQQTDIPLTGGSPVCVLPRNLDRDADMDLIVLIDPGNAAGKI